MHKVKTKHELGVLRGDLAKAMSETRAIKNFTQKTFTPMKTIEKFILDMRFAILGGDKGAMKDLEALNTHLDRAFNSSVKLLDFLKKKRRDLEKIEKEI
jgi:hypothetical protein